MKESERKYNSIYESVHEVFYQTDLKGIILEISPSIKHFSDFKRTELLGTSVYDLYNDPNDRQTLLNAIQKDGEISDYEIKFKTSIGGIKYVSLNARLINDINGIPNHLVGAIRDITDRKLSVESLRENEIKYQELVNNSPDAIAIYVKGRIVFVNNECLKLLGASVPEELIGKPVMDFVHPDYRALVIARMKDATAEGTVLPLIDEKFARLDGSIIDVEVKAMSIRLDNKPAVQLIVRDITEKKKARETRAKLEKAIYTSGEAIFLTDREGLFTFVNPAFTKLYGFTSEEIVVKSTPRIIKSGVSDISVYEYFWKTLLNGEEVKGELINKKKDGTLVTIDGSATPIIDEARNIIGFLGIQRDITERKKAEQELFSAIEKAEESDRLKTAFLNNISHEIRTPFNGILGFLSLLQDNELPGDERDQYIGIINQSADRLMNTINEIVEISQIQAGKTEVTLAETSISALTGELANRYSKDATKLGLEFIIYNNLPSGLENITTDSGKLNIVLSNLISNSLKFTKTGSIELRISKNIDFLEFSVKDSGIGIPENQKQAIFERFIQADISRTRQFEGLGLGLSIAKYYVEMLGGTIWFESEEGKGSTFHFTLPFNT